MTFHSRCPRCSGVCWALVLGFGFLGLASAGCDHAPSATQASATPGHDSAQPDAGTAKKKDDFRARLDKVIEYTQRERHPDTKTQAAWQIVHGLLSYGPALQIEHDGKLVSASEYLLQGGELTGWKLFPADHGVATAVEGGSKTGQGHPDQWLGYMAQCGIPKDAPLVVAGKNYTVNDMITEAQWECTPGKESAFTLMAFSVYLPLDAEWTAKDGSKWTIARLLDVETQPDVDDDAWLAHLRDTACGGSHPMFAVASAVTRYRESGQPLTGSWKKADERLKLVVSKAHEFQQPDGSLSTEFFLRPATKPDLLDKLYATGHTFEFLAKATSDDELRSDWMKHTATYLVNLLEATEQEDLECGALYHGSHGLIIYRERMFPEQSKQ